MLVFIDESGDAGFKTARGSSPVFVVAMAIFADGAAALDTEVRLRQCAARRIHRGEFKFMSTRRDVRDMFFETARSCPFRLRAIVVRKDAVYSAHLRSDKEGFYQFFVQKMLEFDGGRLKEARVVIDGSGDREFRKRLGTAIRKRVREGAVKECRFSDSKGDALIQLADMCAGAIARSYRPDRDDRDRWRMMLQPRIDDIWDFR